MGVWGLETWEHKPWEQVGPCVLSQDSKVEKSVLPRVKDDVSQDPEIFLKLSAFLVPTYTWGPGAFLSRVLWALYDKVSHFGLSILNGFLSLAIKEALFQEEMGTSAEH